MKQRYRIWLILLLCIILGIICGIARTNIIHKWYEGNEGLIEKAKEEMNISTKDEVEIIILGSVDINNRALVWFMSEDSNNQHEYCALEFKINDKDSSLFQFVKNCNAKYIEPDAYICNWNLEENNTIYSFAIKNETFSKIKFEYKDGQIEEIDINNREFPLYTSDFNPVKYGLYNELGQVLSGDVIN